MRGNPFRGPTNAMAVRMYRCWLMGSLRTAPLLDCRKVVPGDLAPRRTRILAEVGMISGYEFIGCWCRLDEPCHGDVLLDLAFGPLPGPELPDVLWPCCQG